ncbi:MAG TPA: thiosulfate oxidation carrier complex protein SoxZ [Gammaproteobacteria bacterium]|nr:thiosulfate oxidation carrier complex protein SoxZ [Gammaproteobacteria bacterium]
MARTIKMKIKKSGSEYRVLVLVKHPMETGRRKDKKTGKLVPAHYIETMTFSLNGKLVAEANMGTGVSKNPLLGISLTAAKPGDKVSIHWADNKGESGSVESVVK